MNNAVERVEQQVVVDEELEYGTVHNVNVVEVVETSGNNSKPSFSLWKAGSPPGRYEKEESGESWSGGGGGEAVLVI